MNINLAMNPYLFGSLILLAAWSVTLIVLFGKSLTEDLREFCWGSLTCSLLGFSEPLFVPEYWSPPSILSVRRWDLESFLFCFAVGGIAAVLPEFPRAKALFFVLDYRLWRLWRWLKARAAQFLLRPGRVQPTSPPFSEVRLTKPELRRENMLLLAFLFGAFGTTTHFDLNIIYDVAIMCVAVAGFIGWRTPGLRWQIVGGALSFLMIYSVVLWIVAFVYPKFYVEHWNLPALSGRWLLGAPVEEYLFAATLGLFWAPLYETWKNERDAPAPQP